jgi:chorismate dehydratase
MTPSTMHSSPEIQNDTSYSCPSNRSRKPVRIGAVSYLNTKPLIYQLKTALANRGVLSLDLPSTLADDLVVGKIDIGLIPVVEYFQYPEFQIVSDAVIACRGPVWSVRIFFRCDPSQVKTLALDEGSRTSAALSKVLFHQRFGFVPDTVPLRMTENPIHSAADAVLVIGDRAMHPEYYRGVFRCDWDLGQIWLEETGLPFVFAMWVARASEFETAEWKCMFENARDLGVKNIREIAALGASDYRLSAEQCQDYLTNYIRFYLRNDEVAGLVEFRRRCVELGLVSN